MKGVERVRTRTQGKLGCEKPAFNDTGGSGRQPVRIEFLLNIYYNVDDRM
ncbi:MAG: hypothetical protein ACM3TR_00090 [Caulobacteraceae bacterium]